MSEALKDRLLGLLSRKFLGITSAMVSVTTLCAMGKVHETVYSTVMIAALGIYSYANVTQKKSTTNTGVTS